MFVELLDEYVFRMMDCTMDSSKHLCMGIAAAVEIINAIRKRTMVSGKDIRHDRPEWKLENLD